MVAYDCAVLGSVTKNWKAHACLREICRKEDFALEHMEHMSLQARWTGTLPACMPGRQTVSWQ